MINSSPLKLVAGLPSFINRQAEEPLLPQDFGSHGCQDSEKTVVDIRKRHVQGLQSMLQIQCEALVEKFEVNPLICSMAMTIWLKYLMVSRVLGDDCMEQMIHKAKLAGVEAGFKRVLCSYPWRDHVIHWNKAIDQ